MEHRDLAGLDSCRYALSVEVRTSDILVSDSGFGPDGRPAEIMVRYGAVDVYYPPSGGARAALIVAAEPTFATVVDERVAWLAHIAAYEPGAFFRRELPATRVVLEGAHDMGLLIVDGYVDLDPAGRPGLGARLHDEVGIPVIGVAKTAFRSATHAAAVRRGGAIRPLYVTAAGLGTSKPRAW
jgi:deoxyribonuclease V